jgi:hypothetical protein
MTEGTETDPVSFAYPLVTATIWDETISAEWRCPACGVKIETRRMIDIEPRIVRHIYIEHDWPQPVIIRYQGVLGG